MTLQEFSRDVVPVLNLVTLLTGLGTLLLLFRQLKIVQVQFSESTKWNKLQSHHAFFKSIGVVNAEQDVLSAAEQAEVFNLVYRNEAITKEEAIKLANSPEAVQALRVYLNYFEQLSGAVLCGLVDGDYAYSTDGFRLVRAFRVYAPFIREIRERFGQHSILSHFEVLQTEWKERLQQDNKRVSSITVTPKRV